MTTKRAEVLGRRLDRATRTWLTALRIGGPNARRIAEVRMDEAAAAVRRIEKASNPTREA